MPLPPDRVSIIIGPDLGHPATEEAEAIAAIHPNARVLRDATVQQALEAFEHSDLVHLRDTGFRTPMTHSSRVSSSRMDRSPPTTSRRSTRRRPSSCWPPVASARRVPPEMARPMASPECCCALALLLSSGPRCGSTTR
ncbi:MAG: hypothetical protein R2710_25615 [Acidimicrobiales bacterium]